MNVILASQSPRRRELMGLFPFPFEVRVAGIEEDMDYKADPEAEVARLSQQKAAAILRTPEDVVIAADTMVVCHGYILGKPEDEKDAYEMLTLLSGRYHQVMTGVTVLCGDRSMTHTEVTDVLFRTLTEQEIRAYIASGEPMDKAGAYGIQGRAAMFVQKIVGDYFNVVGLPVCRLEQMLKKIAPGLMEEEV